MHLSSLKGLVFGNFSFIKESIIACIYPIVQLFVIIYKEYGSTLLTCPGFLLNLKLAFIVWIYLWKIVFLFSHFNNVSYYSCFQLFLSLISIILFVMKWVRLIMAMKGSIKKWESEIGAEWEVEIIKYKVMSGTLRILFFLFKSSL